MSDYTENDWVIEPANVAVIHCINSINIANYSRNKCNRSGAKSILVNKKGITGDVKLNPGYNCTISERGNVFTIESVKGRGYEEGYQGASRVPMTDSEAERIEAGEFLDDCVMCNETIKAINGINGDVVRIQGGNGVSVTPQDKHTLVIKLETQQFKTGCENENENENETETSAD